MENEITPAYLKLDKKFKLNLKTQIKGTGLFIEKFLSVIDIITEKKYYALIINSKVLFFDNLIQLCTNLERIITSEIKGINEEIKLLQEHRTHDLVIDKAAIRYELDELLSREDRLCKMLEKLQKTHANYKNNSS